MTTKHMSRAEREAREMIAEMKMQKAVDAAYNRADKTEPAPMMAPRAPMPPRPAPEPSQAMPQDQMGNATGMKKGGKVKDSMYMSFSESGKPAGMKPVKMASGGSVFRSSANGIAERGKTKGKMVTMCGGGKM
jgi:hypothetical protein